MENKRYGMFEFPIANNVIQLTSFSVVSYVKTFLFLSFSCLLSLLQ